MSRLFSRPVKSQGQQIAHVRAWRRQKVALVKTLWNEGVAVEAICVRLDVSEDFVDNCVRQKICADAGPAVMPRRGYGRNQKRQLREQLEVPG